MHCSLLTNLIGKKLKINTNMAKWMERDSIGQDIWHEIIVDVC